MAGAGEVSESNRRIARLLAHTFGARPRVIRYWDDARVAHVDVAGIDDHPDTGLSSYGTIGLSDYPLLRDGEEYPARLEIVGAAEQRWRKFPAILASAAFSVTNLKWFCMPGAVFPDVVSMHEPDVTSKHLFFVPPFLWEDELKTLDLPDKTVAWLMAIPITERERAFTAEHGPDALEDLFAERQVEYFNLDRPSLV